LFVFGTLRTCSFKEKYEDKKQKPNHIYLVKNQKVKSYKAKNDADYNNIVLLPKNKNKKIKKREKKDVKNKIKSKYSQNNYWNWK